MDKRNRQTRNPRWEQLDSDLEYDAKELDRAIVSQDQIRTVIRTFRDKLFTEIFPGRTEVPKTLIFAKDDTHAEDIVHIVREEFDKGNDFCSNFQQVSCLYSNAYSFLLVFNLSNLAQEPQNLPGWDRSISILEATPAGFISITSHSKLDYKTSLSNLLDLSCATIEIHSVRNNNLVLDK